MISDRGEKLTDPGEAIHVRLDLHAAVDAVRLDADQRAWLTVRFNEDHLGEIETGHYLGWSIERVERVRRSLRADRVIGAGLRQFLRAYAKNVPGAVRKISETAA